MALAPGAQFGPYQIVSPIGAGGMGEVYRARDTRLDRDVAIKVLPPHLADDASARSRFEREAKAIAALSHPNILAVYDVGTVDGTAFVVMELLEGETLRQRLSPPSGSGSAALPARKVIQIGIDIAQALAAAHEKQVVHRDIKPENVFVAADGHVKLLDFGLARHGAPATRELSATDAATELRKTDPGTVLGTIGYMASEQVKGLAVDHRADIFALGCVLYEMASGRRPFERASTAETMSAILRDDPPDLVPESGAVAASLEPIVRHCLEKRPEERFQSARDLAFALQSLGTGGAGAVSQASSGASLPRPVEATPRRRVSTGLIVAAAGVAIAAFAAGRFSGGGAAPAGAGLRIERFQQVTDVAGVETSPTLSPDGKTIVYVSAKDGSLQIYSQRVGSRSATALTSGSSNTTPAFSPEGERIVFRSDRNGGGIFLMTSSGESITRVSDEGFSPSWSPDGTQVVVARGTFVSPTDVASTAPGLFAIDVKSGTKRELIKTGQTLQPAWSPHGYRVAYFTLRQGTGQRDLFTVAADGSEAEGSAIEVTNDAPMDWSPSWSPEGDYLYFSSNRGGTMNLWRVPINERTGRVLGEPEPVTTPSHWSGMISFSRDGLTMAFASLDWRSSLLRQNLDPATGTLIGTPTPLLRGSRPIRDHAISPDGQWVAFNETAAREDLFVARVDGTEYRRLTDDAARDRGPAWSPDGKTLYFYSDRGGTYDIWKIDPDGSHPEQLTKGTNANFPVVSPDGTRLAFTGVSAAGLSIRPVGADMNAFPPIEPPMSDGLKLWAFSWSADGSRLLGFAARTNGTVQGPALYDIAAKQYRLIGGQEDEGFCWPVWLRDGRRFLIRTTSGISLVNADTGARKLLTHVRGYTIGKSLSVAADNTWYSYTETGTEGDLWIAVVRR